MPKPLYSTSYWMNYKLCFETLNCLNACQHIVIIFITKMTKDVTKCYKWLLLLSKYVFSSNRE